MAQRERGTSTHKSKNTLTKQPALFSFGMGTIIALSGRMQLKNSKSIWLDYFTCTL